jgi:hypothetical protein
MSKDFLYQYDSEKLLANFAYFFFNEYKEGTRNIDLISQNISKKTKWNTYYIKGLIDNLNENGFVRIACTPSGDFVSVIDGAGLFNFIDSKKDLLLHEKEKQKFFNRYLPIFTSFFHRIYDAGEFRKTEFSFTKKYLKMLKEPAFKRKAEFCYKILSEYEIYNFFDYIKIFCVQGKANPNIILKINDMDKFYNQFLSSEIVARDCRKTKPTEN